MALLCDMRYSAKSAKISQARGSSIQMGMFVKDYLDFAYIHT